jgi:hypothetical protein
MQPFKKTQKQAEAVKLMGGLAKFILLRGGSRSGKSLIIIYTIIMRALKEPGSRHLVVRFAFNHAKQSLWHDTIPKCLELCFPGVRPEMNKSDWYLEFPNGSQIWLGGLDDKDRTEKILGNEYCSIFLNEVSQISYSSYTLCVTRLAQKTGLVNKIYADCNPPSRKHWTYKLWFEHKDPVSNEPVTGDLYATMMLNPDDNRENLPDDYIESVLGTLSRRQQQRFRFGEYTDDIEGALWTYEIIDKNRVTEPPQFVRVVVAIDPSGSGKQSADEAGVVCCGVDRMGEGYVLSDKSGHLSPTGWAVKAISLYHQYEADAIVAEVNQGWDMVETVIRGIDPDVRVIKVTASRGKVTRAEPIVAKYEQGLVHHVGSFGELEDEMCTWDSRESIVSPGRIDALVYALTELLTKKQREFVVV